MKEKFDCRFFFFVFFFYNLKLKIKFRVTLLHENLATLTFSDFENSFFSGTLILRFVLNFGA